MTCLDDASRRRFLEMGSMLLVAGAATACNEGAADDGLGDETGGDGDETDASATESSSEATTEGSGEGSGESSGEESGGEVCEETPPQGAGPFPQEGFERTDLDLYGHAGVPLLLRGRLLDADCEPVSNAQIVLWHATPSAPGVMPATVQADPEYVSAVYDHPNQAGAMAPDGSEIPTGEQMYYGWTTTDAEGAYSFSTLRPGWYLNGSAYRPAHLHLRVFVDGVEQLTTQLYFPEDPFNEFDSILQNACGDEGCLLVYEDDDGAEASFDLHVAL